ncbi:tripartite tricarboxylate transporter permease [Candidatus Woesearchaeota archaeon]|nr:tripartite tricarboxylate transporter permease [Candidatus Woesearchaeota archaeon]
MLIEIAVAVLLGIFIGIFTGITPGIHVNLVAATLLAFSPILLKQFAPLTLAVFIMALAVTHSFLDTIPSIYLGAPDDENALSVLPGQRMLLRGEGYQAVKITILGTYTGLVTAICFIPVFILIANKLYPILKPYLVYALILIIIFMIFREKNWLWSFILFSISGTLGVLVFSIPNMKEPMFPLLSGLFGVSGLLISFFENTKIPAQKITKDIEFKLKELLKVLSASSIAVFFIQFFPGMGPSQGAVISSQLIRNIKDKGYLCLVGAMGTMSVVFSLVTFYTLNKAKDGSIVVMSKLTQINFNSFMIIVLTFLTAGSVAVFLTLWFAKQFSRIIIKINYKLLVISIIAFVTGMAIFLDKWTGLLVLVTAAAVGLIAPLKNIGRNHAMGCLLLPVLVYLVL